MIKLKWIKAKVICEIDADSLDDPEEAEEEIAEMEKQYSDIIMIAKRGKTYVTKDPSTEKSLITVKEYADLMAEHISMDASPNNFAVDGVDITVKLGSKVLASSYDSS